MLRRIALFAVAGLAMSVAVAGCTTKPGEGKSGGNVSVGLVEPRSLIPTNVGEVSGSQVLAALFTPLVDFDESGKPFDSAAESVTTSDNKTWRIKIKPSFTFHNGEKVTADSYINAWNYGAYAKNAQENATFFGRVEGFGDVNPEDPDGESGPQKAPEPKTDKMSGLKKVDDRTFDVVLSEPFSGWRAILGYTAFYPFPESFFKDSKAFNEAPVGNGAFKMKGTWQHNVKIEVERYNAYPDKKPKIDSVEFRLFQDTNAEYDSVLSGQLDVQKTVPTDKLGVVESDFGDRYLHSPSSTFQGVTFPEYMPQFKDRRIRKALSMAIDREEIVKTIFKGTQKAAFSWVSPVVVGYRPNVCGETCKYDAAKAKTLFNEANGPTVLPRTTIMYNADGGHKDWVDATCNQIQNNLGIQCTGASEPKFADLLNKLDAQQGTGMFRAGWVFDYPWMENYLRPLYGKDGSSNFSGWSNADFDRLVTEGDKASTVEEATKKYQEAEDILPRELPALPLRYGQNNFVHSKRVKNVSIDLFYRLDLLKIEVVG